MNEQSIAVENFIRFKHSVNPGDLIAAMGAIKKYYDIMKRDVVVCQQINMAAQYYSGAIHPTVDENGTMVCCNEPIFNMLKPLIESQYYVSQFVKYDGQKIDIDLDVIRGHTNVNLPNGAIQNWISFAWPDLQFDLSKPWIFVNDECPEHIKQQTRGKIIVNFTERYRNHQRDYFFLKSYAPDMVFAGTESEYWKFCTRWQLDIPRLQINDFLEYAHAIKECRFFLGNQSMGWNLCDAMKKPRILEVCVYAQNCIHGVGEHSYGYLHQQAVEYYVRKLDNITK